MTIRKEYNCTPGSPGAMQRLGYEIGLRLKKGVVLQLQGDLGSGKTCFVQGLARGLDVPEGFHITSPTYALVHDYPGRLPLVHVDLYRIHDESDAESIGLWEFINDDNVVAVEWADRLEEEIWPSDSLMVRIEMAEVGRRVRLIGCGLQMADLIMEISKIADDQ